MPSPDNEAMTGIEYVADEKGRKVAVQLDLKTHRELWKDIEDVLVSRSRRLASAPRPPGWKKLKTFDRVRLNLPGGVAAALGRHGY
jgi:hypothetical protein